MYNNFFEIWEIGIQISPPREVDLVLFHVLSTYFHLVSMRVYMLCKPNCNQILKSKNAVIFVFFVETTQKSHTIKI